MPKIGMPDSRFFGNLWGRDDRKRWRPWEISSNRELVEEAARHGERLVNYEREHIVVASGSGGPGENREVFSYSGSAAENPFRTKTIFYLQRIFSTLFPHNFPRFVAAIGRDVHRAPSVEIPYVPGGTIRKEVIPGESGTVTYPFQQVLETCRKAGVPLAGVIDSGNSENFIVGADGGEYYVDTLNFFDQQAWRMDLLMNFMRETGYSSGDQVAVRTALERLRVIAQEEHQAYEERDAKRTIDGGGNTS